MIDEQFLRRFKTSSETNWSTATIRPSVYGFQFRPGTLWLPGLTADQISEYEDALGMRFPDSLRAFLAEMNGTFPPTVNVYGSSGSPHRDGFGYYSFPTHLEEVRDTIAQLDHTAAEELMDEIGLPGSYKFMPIVGHRFVVCGSDPQQSTMISGVGDDVILWADTLESFLSGETPSCT